MRAVRAALVFALVIVPSAALAADYPAPKQSEWIARDFKFHTGETLPDLRISYTTVGEPSGQPVLVLHGTTGNAGTIEATGAGNAAISAGTASTAKVENLIGGNITGGGFVDNVPRVLPAAYRDCEEALRLRPAARAGWGNTAP